MAVINLRGGRRQTDTADAPLRGDQLITLGFGDAVVALEMSLPASYGFARLTAGGESVRGCRGAMPFTVGLDFPTATTKLVSFRRLHPWPDVLPLGQLSSLVIGGPAFLAVSLQTVAGRLVTGEGCSRLGFLAPRAALHSLFAFQLQGPRNLRFEGYSPPF